ncbi:MAG: DUF423 domain-containing protein [Bacteroidales bacterium]|nr:DUF423 domain-containing protein [Bacteroidales bacterium]
MQKTFFISGAILGGLAVAIGAYGAHAGAKFMDAESMITFGKAVRYQMNHAFALIAVAFALSQWPEQKRLLNWAAYSFLGGIIAFSGSLYLIVFAKLHLGYITPFGGILFVVGWLLLAYAAFKGEKK